MEKIIENNNNLIENKKSIFIDLSTITEQQMHQVNDNLPLLSLTDLFNKYNTFEIRLYVKSFKKTVNRWGNTTLYLNCNIEEADPAFIVRTTSQNILSFINQNLKKIKENAFSFTIRKVKTKKGTAFIVK
jgi:hypothetical protein